MPTIDVRAEDQHFLQELFDTSRAHIRAQGGPAMNANRTCKYRADNGRSCAAGPFVVNYHELMDRDNLVWGQITSKFADDLDPTAVRFWFFVERLQDAHDMSSGGQPTDAEFMERYEAAMTKLAEEWGLTEDL